MARVNIGDKAKDDLTQFEGIVTQRGEYIGDVPQVRIERESKDGKPGESAWFAEPRVSVTASGYYVLPPRD